VYSNCDQAELFLNGKSLGIMRRDSQNFPGAGLRWKASFVKGPNHLRVVATKAGAKVTDEIELSYQTEPWGRPAEFRLTEKGRKGDIVCVGAMAYDAKGVPCLDSRSVIRFSVAGSGKLLDNLGTSRGSRELQLYNGRAEISVTRSGGCTLGITSEGLPAAFLKLS
jgi:beta-galactosidase